MELSKEKSEEQADIIRTIGFLVVQLDTNYCKKVAMEMNNQANVEMSISILKPDYSFIKNEIIKVQSGALMDLANYVEKLKEVERLRQQLTVENKAKNEINKLFL